MIRRSAWLLALLSWCALTWAEPLVFAPLPPAASDAEKRQVRTSPSVRAGQASHTLDYHTVLRSGEISGGHTFGMLTDRDGRPLGRISHRPDFTSLIPMGDKLFALTHFEQRPGAVYLTELAQDSASGLLSARRTRPLDLSGVGGLMAPCAGSVTPWNSHLGGEEYEPDARAFERAVGEGAPLDVNLRAMGTYFGVDPAAPTKALADVLNPYRYGFVTELTLRNDRGDVEVAKHYAMGRASIELGRVMPDGRSVYISDDTTNGGLYLFVADAAGRLDAGRLYAMAWRQQGRNPAQAELDWIDLGHASDADVARLIDEGVGFSEIFDSADPADCPRRYQLVNTRFGAECLRLKRGMALAASRLETRRYAAMLGATTELRKSEGLAFDVERRELYLAVSEIAKGMEDGHPAYDRQGPNHIRLPANECGGVLALSLGPNEKLGSAWAARQARMLIVGSGDGTGGCAENGIANPDNLAMVPGHNTLLIAEDTRHGHQNDALWAFDQGARRLTRIQTTPYGSEVTSAAFYPNLNGWAYIVSVIQHPYGDSDRDKLAPGSTDDRAYVGYIGPLPALPSQSSGP